MSFSEWKEVALEEIVDVLGDGLHGTPKYDENGEYYFINGNNLDGNIIIDEKTKKVSYEEFLKYKKDLNERTILISINGTLGNVAFYNGEKVVLGKSACYFNVKENCSKEFIKYIMLSHAFKHYINTYSTGTTIKNMGLKQMRAFRLNLPEINEQKAIAHVLSTLDEKIEVNNQINKTLENMAQAIFKQWFVDFEFPNEDGEPYKSSGGEMIASELGMIPKGWEVGNLAESKLTNLVKTGIAEFSGEKIYLATADVDKSNILSNTTKVTYNERPSRANMQPKENTVWFAKMKDSRKLIRVSRGSKDLIENYIFSTGFAGINVKEGLNYIWSFICSNDFDIRKNNLCHGTTMQAINNSNISNIPLLLPKEEMIQIFEGVTNYLYESEYLRKKENEKLAEIRDSLLPKLMSGEIRVPLDEEGDAS
ncbi:TPA: restriction endonuclease subunit S [Listeria monocytogenes]|uniref:restriction endonuclease subunit S n=1 Tax=Listeria innocua TaxID=1642 RepID=UPI00180AB40C|nr:restriction endonuclease subunit S [Listeria innocua]MBV1163986.1 restriction endonuclease subunit S [Listeria monocytogenes]MBF2578736.1 restriction endonuclease subunit S [Listeria innocua]MBV1166902.1 restriction endonuclease subunit S [Listeria monocytogenes]MBV1172828.1 restriction endonuclease subunit S [Listeria monocytogenes]MBV1173635.1 restriction endonuclease subunit S [Listeria monocytogenes]